MNEIYNIDERLQELREEYKTATPEKRKFIIAGARLLKDKKLSVEKRAEKENLTTKPLLDRIS